MSNGFYKERSQFQDRIAALEKISTYPLGDDFFQIDHGDDYFAFFDRLGDVNYYVAIIDTQVVAVGAGVLQLIADCHNDPGKLSWYLCDLKVHPMYQNHRISVRLLEFAITQKIQECNRGYLISMNPGNGTPNRLVKMLTKFPIVSLHLATHLNIYSINIQEMQFLEHLLIRHRGPLGYRSLVGIKDLCLMSTGKKFPLIHLQWGNRIEQEATADFGATTIGYLSTKITYMFCAPETDELTKELSERGILPTATASIMSHGMENCNWRTITTSDI
jgi:GNAT superfamily N-acetyltransferase